MKRYYILLLITVITLSNLNAQSFSEWFKQKKTQKKYLLAQIATLETYIQMVEKGYHIAKDGLSTINALKDGDLLQHTLYFNSLKMVSPQVKNYSKVMAIARAEDQSAGLRRKIMSENDLSSTLSKQEFKELQEMNDQIASEETKDLEELKLLVTDGKLKMTDDERIKHIDQLYIEVQKKYNSTLTLSRNIQALIKSRQTDKADNRIIEQLYGKQFR